MVGFRLFFRSNGCIQFVDLNCILFHMIKQFVLILLESFYIGTSVL
uniref:Uncharacterized protein n=1 Tax=Arundo donax TaxID=35708 RepID=A0A0A9TTF7_ARUDO